MGFGCDWLFKSPLLSHNARSSLVPHHQAFLHLLVAHAAAVSQWFICVPKYMLIVREIDPHALTEIIARAIFQLITSGNKQDPPSTPSHVARGPWQVAVPIYQAAAV